MFTNYLLLGVSRLCKDVEFMLGVKTGIYWRICWAVVTPALMIGIFIYFLLTWEPITYQEYEYADGLHGKLLENIEVKRKLK